ncbi:dihydrofolate reductase family protein [Acaricomes phytoseiuli]|uniref:dihydrofolate reductase family protein n=1 Tax=Acaricomes phytoseiuli TaxID=291968 RepID=UPI000370118A|nr:dihydrofolate reductase family protein [Acaricomes phytoseiuli]MCW1248941.1 dihydrofolate reductase family protein [Acaricomes phytoseiuli]
MGKIKVHEFITLDGVVETPSWTAPYGFTERMGEAVGALMSSSSALLLGRNTYEMFASAWPGRTAAEDPGAPFMNDSTKYVVGTAALEREWENTTALGAYTVEGIRELKGQAAGDLYVSGSVTLVRAMLSDKLVDELHLLVYPVVLGSGLRLWPDSQDGQQLDLELLSSESFENGVIHLVYGPKA